jgi:hypothetical protein
MFPMYVDFILEYIADNSSFHKIYFPITHLNIDGFFKIGEVSFEYFTKEYFDRMAHAITINSKVYSKTEKFPEIRKNYQGKVFAAFTAYGEKNRAIEIAFEHCSLAVDALKICTITALEPNQILAFDIDSRLTTARVRDIIVTNPNDIADFKVSKIVDQYPYRINQEEYTQMIKLGLHRYSLFLKDFEQNKNELTILIVESIRKFSSALSQRDLHKRIVELYTLLEALLLPDESSPILESTTKYLPILIEKDIEKRRECAKQIKLMYSVRSKLIHHGKRIDFDIDSLRKIQAYILTLLFNLITESSSHKTKAEVLKEIDDALLGV